MLYAGQEATVRTEHETMDCYTTNTTVYTTYTTNKAVYCHPAYLTYMQSTS